MDVIIGAAVLDELMSPVIVRYALKREGKIGKKR